jgi:pimeloyl-ACP methyl ester carboxylesterase
VRRFEPGCPVLVLCGGEDRTTPPDQAARVAGSLAGARLVHLPGAGHYPFAEALEATVQRIEEFLSALPGH